MIKELKHWRIVENTHRKKFGSITVISISRKSDTAAVCKISRKRPYFRAFFIFCTVFVNRLHSPATWRSVLWRSPPHRRDAGIYYGFRTIHLIFEKSNMQILIFSWGFS